MPENNTPPSQNAVNVPNTPVISPTNIVPIPQPTKKPNNKIVKTVLLIILVITIIAAVISGGMYYLNNQKIVKRDNQRKTDLNTIQQGLEKLKTETLNKSYYPVVISDFTMVQRGYLPSIPKDPTESFYLYVSKPDGCINNCTAYTLTACLENKNDKSENTTNPIAPCTTRSLQITKP